jgi:hypothetical protein
MATTQSIPITSSNVTFEGSMAFGPALVPPILNVDTDNYAPIGLEDTIVLNISSSVAISISGFIAPNPNATKILYIFNVGNKNIIFKDNSLDSLADNRILIGSNKTIQQDEGLILVYDTSILRWKVPAINV